MCPVEADSFLAGEVLEGQILLVVEEVPLQVVVGVEVRLLVAGVVVVPSILEVVVGVAVHPLEEVEGEDHLLKEVVEEVEVHLLMEEEVEVEHQVVEVVEDLLQ